MRLCFDLDETLCTGHPYEDAVPLPGAKELLQRVRDRGHTIAIYTARGMGSCAGNKGLAVATIGEITLRQLKDWGFPYDEIHFGKPSADIYIDDKSISSIKGIYDLLGLSMADSKDILEYRVSQLESNIVTELAKIAGKLEGLDTKATSSLVAQTELGVRMSNMEKRFHTLDEQHEERFNSMEKEQNKLKDELSTVKVGIAQKFGPGAIAGMISAIVVAVIQFFMGGGK